MLYSKSSMNFTSRRQSTFEPVTEAKPKHSRRRRSLDILRHQVAKLKIQRGMAPEPKPKVHDIPILKVYPCENIDDGETTKPHRRFSLLGILERRRRSSASRRCSACILEEEDATSKPLPYDLQGMPESILRLAETELGETSRVKETAIQDLKERILESESSRLWGLDEDILLAFLRAKKFDVQRTYRLMQHFIDFINSFYKLHPFTQHQAQRELDIGYFKIFPFRDPKGRVIVSSRLGSYNTNNMPILTGFSFSITIMSKMLESESNQVTGFVMILDCADLPYGQMKHFTLSNARSLLRHQDAFPARYKAVHVLHENIIFKAGFKLFEMFASKKLVSRVHLHGNNMNSLHQFIPPSILPKRYGGTLEDWNGNFDFDDFNKPKIIQWGFENSEVMQKRTE